MPKATAADFRRRSQWTVDLEDGLTVTVRRVDLVNAYMENLIPLPLMSALDRLRAKTQELLENPTALVTVDPGEKAKSIELLRRYACAAIVEPTFVMEDDGNPDHVPITVLSHDQLLRVWLSKPENPNPSMEVDPAVAERFRVAGESLEAPPAVPPQSEVPPAAEQLPVPEVHAP